LPKAAAKVASGFLGGTLSLKDYRTALKALPADQAALVTQWVAMENRSKGFNQQLRNGVASSQTASAALQQMLGGATGLNTALMLTGGSAAVFTNNVNTISTAAKGAGKNVSTWASTQKLFKTQLSELGQTISVTGTQIATKMLPGLLGIVKALLSGIQAAVKWASANKSWLEPTVIGVLSLVTAFKLAGLAIAGVSAAIKIAKAVGFAWIAVTQGMTAAQTAFDVAADANPFGLIALAIEAVVAALAALVAGVIWAYNHWKWFHDGVNAAWQGIVTAAQWAWKTVLKPTFDKIGEAVKTAGDVFTWLQKHVIEPVFNRIGAVFTWLWKNIVTPVFNGIVGVVSWFYQFFKAIFTLIGAIIQKDVAPIFTWWWKTIVVPALNGIVAVAQWAWGLLSNVFTGLWNYLSTTLGPVFTWLWKSIIEPAWNGIKAVVVDLWVTFIQPTLTKFHDFIHDTLPNAFKVFGDTVAAVWNNMKTEAMAPIKFVIETVYNNGLVKAFNGAAKFFEGAHPTLLPEIHIPGLAGGGVIPGFQAARRDDVLMPMRRGEGSRSGGGASSRPGFHSPVERCR